MGHLTQLNTTSRIYKLGFYFTEQLFFFQKPKLLGERAASNE